MIVLCYGLISLSILLHFYTVCLQFYILRSSCFNLNKAKNQDETVGPFKELARADVLFLLDKRIEFLTDYK